MQVRILKGGIYYNISEVIENDIAYDDDISKELDTADFIIPVCEASLVGYDLSVPIAPYTKVEITDANITKRYYVREDAHETIYEGTPKLYSHKVSLIEATKLLEVRPVPDIAVTQPQGTYQIALNELDIDPSELTSGSYTLIEEVFNVIPLVNVTEPTNATYFDDGILKIAGREYTVNVVIILQSDATLVLPTWECVLKINGVQQATTTVKADEFDFSKKYLATMSVTYTTSVPNEQVSVEIKATAEGLGGEPGPGVPIVPSNTPVVATTLRTKAESVDSPVTYMDEFIDKLLASETVIDINDTATPEITLADSTRNKINNVVMPDLTYEESTQWEILEDVADIIKAIPRLSKDNWDELTFDFIDDLAFESYTNTNKTEERKNVVMDKYSTSLQINADNVIESIEEQSTKIEPYANGWMTLRSDSDGPNQLTDETLGLKLRSNIYRIKKVLSKGFTVTYTDASSDGPTTEWDISAYIVEQQKWDALLNLPYDSTIDRATVTLGKGNSLPYTKSGQRITGFGYRSPKDTSTSGLKDQAIYQIIASVAQQTTGKTVSSITQSLDVLLGSQYRVEYKAYKKTRMRLYKHDTRDYETKTTLYSTARAKVNDNVKLGRYTQSLVNRSGNVTQEEAGITTTITKVPKIGSVINNDQIITKVHVVAKNGLYEYGITGYVGFSEISEFVGIKSEYRQFEVPDNEIVNRILVYEDNITVSRVSKTATFTPLTNAGLTLLSNPFLDVATAPITYHQMKTREDVLNPGDANWEVFDKESEGPVDIISMGTSTQILMTVKDNYSVDDIVEGKEPSGGTPTKWYQNNYRYTDIFGQYDSARYEIYADGKVDNDVDDGNAYPEIDQPTAVTKSISLDIRVKKDAREAINFAYQCNFFAGLESGVENFRVYNGISKYNGFSIQDVKADIVPVLLLNGYFPSQDDIVIEPTKYVETTMTTLQGLPSGKISVFYDINVEPTPTSILYTGWGLIERNTGELIWLGKENIQSNASTTVVYQEEIQFTPDSTLGE